MKIKPNKKDEGLLVCLHILRYLDVKHTALQVKNLLDDHLDYPSLLAIKDTLQVYGIASAAIRKGPYSYADFETPFACSIQQEDWPQPHFTVVTACDDDHITYLDPQTNLTKSIALEDFGKMDKEIVLLLDGETKKDEVGFFKNKQAEQTEKLMSNIPWYAFGIIFMVSLGSFVWTGAASVWLSLLFLVSSAVGLLVSLLLVWHEVDAHNPFIKEVCGGQGRKMNCDAVLASSGAKFLGISWAVWGFAYFATFFVSQVLFSSNFMYTKIWILLSTAAVVYIPYSLYYQAKVVKQWCPLCLSVLGILGLNAICSIFYLSWTTIRPIDWFSFFHIAVLGITFLLLVYYAVPILKQARESRSYAKRWKKLRYNPDIFQALLAKSNAVTVSAEGLGIVVGNPAASHEIIKVCNPYCGPCAKAHPELEEIIQQNSDVKVRIIFTATGEEDDMKTAPVAHLLAIDEYKGNNIAHTALDDWYMAERKDYEVFAGKYPMNGEIAQQKDKIVAMRNWCDAMKIRATPTVYINGQELPDSYRINELKNFF